MPLAAAALVALIVLSAGERNFALGFCGAAVASLLLFRFGAAGLMALARRLGHLRRPALRLGLARQEVEALGGSVGVMTDVGGTTLYLTIPIALAS